MIGAARGIGTLRQSCRKTTGLPGTSVDIPVLIAAVMKAAEAVVRFGGRASSDLATVGPLSLELEPLGPCVRVACRLQSLR